MENNFLREKPVLFGALLIFVAAAVGFLAYAITQWYPGYDYQSARNVYPTPDPREQAARATIVARLGLLTPCNNTNGLILTPQDAGMGGSDIVGYQFRAYTSVGTGPDTQYFITDGSVDMNNVIRISEKKPTKCQIIYRPD